MSPPGSVQSPVIWIEYIDRVLFDIQGEKGRDGLHFVEFLRWAGEDVDFAIIY